MSSSASGSSSSPSSGSSPTQTPSSVSNTPTPSSTTPTPTSSSSTTPNSSTPANTTPNSTPAQGSSAGATTPTAVQGSSAADSVVSTTAQVATTFSSTYTSEVPTTVFSTAPGGSVTFFTTTIPEVFTTAVSTSVPTSSSSSPNNTGLIVGAVVGGVAGIIVLVLLLFCIRKRVNQDDFDGNFDPDRVVGHTPGGGGTLPHVDLADEVNPFQQGYSDQGNGSMRQYGKSPYVPSLPTSGHASTDFYQPGAMGAGMSTVDAQPGRFMSSAGPPPPGAYAHPVSMYGTGPADWHSPRPGVSPPPSTVSNNTSSTRVTKEREAIARSGQGAGLGLATQQETPEGSGDVVVHQDAGRAPAEEQAPPREIPPSYDSIRQD